jgi:hypothetical protein
VCRRSVWASAEPLECVCKGDAAVQIRALS